MEEAQAPLHPQGGSSPAAAGKLIWTTARHGKLSRECAICLDPLADDWSDLKLPCSHVFHGSCAKGLRARGVAKLCPAVPC